MGTGRARAGRRRAPSAAAAAAAAGSASARPPRGAAARPRDLYRLASRDAARSRFGKL